MYHKMVKIGHTHHKVETQDRLKKSLSPYDDKKCINKNGGELKKTVLGIKIYQVNINTYIYLHI